MSGIVRLKFLGSGGYYVTDTTPFRGMDFETKQFVIAEDNDVVLVSETYAQMLLTDYPAQWRRDNEVALFDAETIEAAATGESEEVDDIFWTSCQITCAVTYAGGASGNTVITVQRSEDGDTWHTLGVVDYGDSSNTLVATKTLTGTGTVVLGVTTGVAHLRITVAKAGSGSITVTASALLEGV